MVNTRQFIVHLKTKRIHCTFKVNTNNVHLIYCQDNAQPHITKTTKIFSGQTDTSEKEVNRCAPQCEVSSVNRIQKPTQSKHRQRTRTGNTSTVNNQRSSEGIKKKCCTRLEFNVSYFILPNTY